MDDSKRLQGGYLLRVFRDQQNFGLRIEDPHLLDRVVEILWKVSVVKKQESDVGVHVFIGKSDGLAGDGAKWQKF